MPFDASSSGPELDARSIGARRIALEGSARARKIGKRTNAGVVRSGRKYRRRKRTATHIEDSETTVKMADPVPEVIVISCCVMYRKGNAGCPGDEGDVASDVAGSHGVVVEPEAAGDEWRTCN